MSLFSLPEYPGMRVTTVRGDSDPIRIIVESVAQGATCPGEQWSRRMRTTRWRAPPTPPDTAIYKRFVGRFARLHGGLGRSFRRHAVAAATIDVRIPGKPGQ